MLDSDNYFETCHNHFPNAMWMDSSSLLVLVHSACYHKFAMVMMAMDGTFDEWLAPLVLHKIVAVNYCCWAFDINQLVQWHPLNMLVKPNDAKHKPVNHLSALVKLLTLEIKRKFHQKFVIKFNFNHSCNENENIKISPTYRTTRRSCRPVRSSRILPIWIAGINRRWHRI